MRLAAREAHSLVRLLPKVQFSVRKVLKSVFGPDDEGTRMASTSTADLSIDFALLVQSVVHGLQEHCQQALQLMRLALAPDVDATDIPAPCLALRALVIARLQQQPYTRHAYLTLRTETSFAGLLLLTAPVSEAEDFRFNQCKDAYEAHISALWSFLCSEACGREALNCLPKLAEVCRTVPSLGWQHKDTHAPQLRRWYKIPEETATSSDDVSGGSRKRTHHAASNTNSSTAFTNSPWLTTTVTATFTHVRAWAAVRRSTETASEHDGDAMSRRVEALQEVLFGPLSR